MSIRRRDSIREDNDIWVKLSDVFNVNLIKHVTDDIPNEQIRDFSEMSDEEKNYYIQYSVLPLKNNAYVLYSSFIRVPKFIAETNPEIYIWEQSKINKKIEELVLSDKNLKFPDNMKSLEAIKAILTKMEKIKASDVTLSWRDTNVVISYAINGKNIKEYEDYLSSVFAEKVKISLVNISYENQALKLINGTFSIYVLGSLREYRLSIIETVKGYSIVIRSYPMFSSETRLDDLGYTEKAREIIDSIIENNPYGVFLVTGPTGSGKTTTIYTILNEQFQNKNLKIKTAEDPVEIEINGIDQCQINEKGERENWVSYIDLLKSFMRQRPDIIVIGEIRDESVAKVTIEAALTGHAVITTLHTNNIKSTFTRLRENLGITTDRIEDSVSGVLSQRLVRKLCDCKIKDGDFYKRNEDGCEKCKEEDILGYKGQIPAVEVAELKKDIKNYLNENFVKYYSYLESANDLYSQGLIDKHTKEYIEKFQ